MLASAACLEVFPTQTLGQGRPIYHHHHHQDIEGPHWPPPGGSQPHLLQQAWPQKGHLPHHDEHQQELAPDSLRAAPALSTRAPHHGTPEHTAGTGGQASCTTGRAASDRSKLWTSRDHLYILGLLWHVHDGAIVKQQNISLRRNVCTFESCMRWLLSFTRRLAAACSCVTTPPPPSLPWVHLMWTDVQIQIQQIQVRVQQIQICLTSSPSPCFSTTDWSGQFVDRLRVREQRAPRERVGGDLPVYTFWPHGLDVGGGVWGGVSQYYAAAALRSCGKSYHVWWGH